jgi:hypothetical protein
MSGGTARCRVEAPGQSGAQDMTSGTSGNTNAGTTSMSVIQTWVANLTRQAAFTRGYSPLYGAILDSLAAWLPGPDGDAATMVRRRFKEFIATQAWDNDLEPILKMAAALHAFVLAGDPRVARLRPYYLTVATVLEARPVGEAFADDLRAALDDLGEDLVKAARAWVIQTNETARGVVWLLPAALLQIEAVHLVELGTSAGLNLFADLRRFDLRWPEEAVTLGLAEAAQFEMACAGPGPGAVTMRAPEVVTRIGVDVRAVDLDAPGAEVQLAACVWGDQPQRMRRLQEALALRRQSQGTAQAARLVRARLPDELEEFLTGAVPAQAVAPVVLFDTYVTAYFNDVDHGALVRGVDAFARAWTLRHRLPWLWVRFEPPRAGEADAPEAGWCRWWVEVWTQGKRRRIELGWAHPHCVKATFGPGLVELIALGGPE